jgi:hypothetical protein
MGCRLLDLHDREKQRALRKQRAIVYFKLKSLVRKCDTQLRRAKKANDLPEIAELWRRAVQKGTLQPGSAAASFLLQIVRNLARMNVGPNGGIRRQGCRYDDEQAMSIYRVLLYYGGPCTINFLQVNNLPVAPTATTVKSRIKQASFQTASCEAQLKAEAWWDPGGLHCARHSDLTLSSRAVGSYYLRGRVRHERPHQQRHQNGQLGWLLRRAAHWHGFRQAPLQLRSPCARENVCRNHERLQEHEERFVSALGGAAATG